MFIGVELTEGRAALVVAFELYRCQSERADLLAGRIVGGRLGPELGVKDGGRGGYTQEGP